MTGKTAAELIVSRADANRPNMALTSWKGTIVRKQDIFIAKNYLNHEEIDTLNRLVIIFLETAELRAKNRNDLTIHFWKDNVDRILNSNDLKVLTGPGSVSNAQMEAFVRKLYQTFDTRRKVTEAAEADLEDAKALEASEQTDKPEEKGEETLKELETLQQEVKAKK